MYALIVGSVISLGLLTDYVWQRFETEFEVGPEERALVQLLSEMVSSSRSSPEAMLAWHSHVSRAKVDARLYVLDDFSGSNLEQQIVNGQLVRVHGSKDYHHLYQRVPESSKVVAVRLPHQETRTSISIMLLCGFYIMVGITVFFWVWPLTRDLQNICRVIKTVCWATQPPQFEVSLYSPVRPIADAINTMSQRIRDLMATRREMTHAISHELRTPLARMKFLIADLESTDLSAEQDENLRDLASDVNSMESLIQAFLHYASFDRSKQALDLEHGDVVPLINCLAGRLMLKDRLVVKSYLGEVQLKCSWELLELCLINLLQNASRYAKSVILVSIYLDQLDFSITVEDDGPGVPENERDTIFDAFVSVRRGEQAHGIGLGLALVNRIMEWHNGRARVLGSPLGGACFELRWPRNQNHSDSDIHWP